MSSGKLPDHLQQLVHRELNSGENLLWAGQPSPYRFVLGSCLVSVFGMVFLGFAIFWTSGAFWMREQHRNAPWGNDFMTQAFPYFGLIFVVVGALMVLSPLWAFFQGASTAYAVTDQRAIILETGLFGNQVRSFGPAAVADITRREQEDGSGDLIFATETYYQSGHWSGSGSHRHYHPGGYRTREIGFFGIPDVRHVERLVREVGPRKP